MIDPDTPLSSAGLRKREQILAVALLMSSRRRHRRLLVHCALGCGVAICVWSLLSRIEYGTAPAPIQVHVVEPSPPTPAPVPAAQPAPNLAMFHRNHEIVITRVQTDPRMTADLAVHPSPQSIQRIGDDELLDELALARQPAGLARLGGKTLLLFRNSHSE